MTIAAKLTGPAFEAALKSGVRKDSHHSLNKCENAMKRVLETLGISRREVASHVPTYMALRDRICDFAKSL
jgi:hypothetical protein